jgi:molecular chaperone GrpE (heat shock protein)
MDNYKEVIENILSLIDTIEDAISYINSSITDKKNESIIILEDTINALDSIDNALKPIPIDADKDNLVFLLDEFKVSVIDFLNALKNDKDELNEHLDKVTKSFIYCKNVLDKLFRNTNFS